MKASVSCRGQDTPASDEQQACRLALAARLLLRKAITPASTGCVTAWATMQSRRPARSGCEAEVSRPPVLSCPYGRSCSASGTRIGGIATLRFVGTSYEGQGLANRRDVASGSASLQDDHGVVSTEGTARSSPPRLSRPSGNLGTRPTSRRPNALSWRKEQSASIAAAGRPGFYNHRKRRPLAIEPRGANPRGRVGLPIPEAPRPCGPCYGRSIRTTTE
jgi:hypothetical protein